MSRLLVVLRHYGADEYDPDRTTGKIRCPVHEERRASCSFDSQRELLNCFSCGFQGDAVNLIMAKEDVDVATAIKRCEAITGSSHGAASAEPAPRSAISGRPGYKPKYKRGFSAGPRKRHFE
jgi:hypothetical protein